MYYPHSVSRGTPQNSSSLEGLKRPSYRICARNRCIWISFLNRNLSISGFCHSSAPFGKLWLYPKRYKFFDCLLSFSEKQKGCPLFIYKWVDQYERALIICHALHPSGQIFSMYYCFLGIQIIWQIKHNERIGHFKNFIREKHRKTDGVFEITMGMITGRKNLLSSVGKAISITVHWD